MTDRIAEGTAARDRADFLVSLLGDLTDDQYAVAYGCLVLAALAYGPDAADADVLQDALKTMEGLFNV